MPDFKIAVIPVTAFQQNCSLIWHEATKRAAVIDPGGEAARIHAAVTELGLQVEKILLTHGHLDHAGAAQPLQALLQKSGASVPVIGPDPRDRFLLEGIETAQLQLGITGLCNVTPDAWLAEGDTVELGTLRFDVLHVPGHTPGHVVFVEPTARFAFVGDTLFRGSVGRTDFPYGDGALLIEGIREKLLPLGDDIAFICGHGPASSFGAERQSNPFLRG
jgi:glyoxylase-like metal-dependent hydrolase (beta-lactamase superfamily II)